MRRSLQGTASVLCLAVICSGVGYGVGRERLRQRDLHQFYQQVNRESFRGELPDVTARWSYLVDEYGETDFNSDTPVIMIDRDSVTSEQQLRKTMRHEACHVATHEVVEETGQDAHGEAFQGCMMRFE